MRKAIKSFIMFIVSMTFITACNKNEINEQNEKWNKYKNIYTTSVQNTGEDDSVAK